MRGEGVSIKKQMLAQAERGFLLKKAVCLLKKSVKSTRNKVENLSCLSATQTFMFA